MAGSGTVDLIRDIAHLKRKPLLLRAIRYLRDEPGWSGYRKAVEALGEQVGGVDRIAELGWASQDEVHRFRETAHHHRHHRKPQPPNPMDEIEGRLFVLRLMRKGLDWSGGRSARRSLGMLRPLQRRLSTGIARGQLIDAATLAGHAIAVRSCCG